MAEEDLIQQAREQRLMTLALADQINGVRWSEPALPGGVTPHAMLSHLLGLVLRRSNGAQLIMTAFGGPAIVFGAMASLASTVQRDLSSSLGKWLFAGLMVIIVASLANIFLHLPALMLTVSVLAIVIFSAFMLVDLQRIINGGETNYVTATLAVYLDVYNVFTNLLMLLSAFTGNNRN